MANFRLLAVVFFGQFLKNHGSMQQMFTTFFQRKISTQILTNFGLATTWAIFS
jgi:hypothetical protein